MNDFLASLTKTKRINEPLQDTKIASSKRTSRGNLDEDLVFTVIIATMRVYL
jgi:hypothetical protein